MSDLFPVFFIIFFACLLASVVGIFKKQRSLLFVFAGLSVMIAASLGALHAYGEGPSYTAVSVYAGIAIMGLISGLRNLGLFSTRTLED